VKPEENPILTPLADDPLWYKDAVIYEVHVKAFFDSNADGIGDFRGLTAKLDYLQDLGVNAIWLLPFYPSPMKDDGYDIADYHNVHPDFGTRKDFRELIREAHRRGLRVITELVINHTSDQHPWFLAARCAPSDSPKRDFYVWSDSDKKFPETRIIFSDTEKSNWTWDEVAKAYYWHRFFSHQPDLNHNNPKVVRAVTRLMRFWLDLGVDGLRLDAIPYLCVREGTSNENLPETHAVVKQMRAVIDAHYQNRLFLAEANQWPEDVRDYFGDGDECHMAYHFPLMPRMYMAIAQEDRHPITEIMAQTPDIPESCQWAIFLRNHDELTLEMVTSKERDYLWQMYAIDPRARLNLGIRRRLAPLLENDLDKIKLMNSLLLSMPGSPIIYYGDEIGMGDNIYLGDRNGVRTPMQWSPDRNAGFSRADPQRLYLPPIMDPVYGFEAVNVEAQQRDPSSLLNWMKRMLAVRRHHRAFGRGQLTFLRPGNRKILAYVRDHGEDTILCVANLARSAQPVELDLVRYKGRVPVELMGRAAFPPIGDLPYLLTLPGHCFYWFRLTKGEEVPAWHEERLTPDELPVLVLFDGWRSFFRERVVPWRIGMAEKLRSQFETEILPRYVAAQRWYAAKGEPVVRVALADFVEWGGEPAPWLVGLVRVSTPAAEPAVYFLPLSLAWEDDAEAATVPGLVPGRTSVEESRDSGSVRGPRHGLSGEERLRGLLPATLARVRQQARVGVLADALADEAFCRETVQAMGEGRTLRCGDGTIRFIATGVFAELAAGAGELDVHPPGAQGSNTTVRLGERLFLKVYRRLHAGVNPELEMGRFLTETARFPNVVPLAGAIEYAAADGTSMTLALLQGYVENQGDGWSYTLDYLERFLDNRRTAPEPPAEAAELHGGYAAILRTLGRRTAELHRALATPSGDKAFDPEPIEHGDLVAWTKQVHAEARQTLELLAQRRAALGGVARVEADALLARSDVLLRRIETGVPAHTSARKTRYHGDFHLGQVLIARNDFYIIDFEGEPRRPLAERRAKHSALKDVAGMLRSFNYATYMALAHVTAERPMDMEALEPHARQWEQVARRAFLEAYVATTAEAGLYPPWNEMEGLLELLVLEKALYELRYELTSRPEWAWVPLLGLRDLA
jgi:maltose alpha-D-glucosyltransferase/alpha-amylase